MKYKKAFCVVGALVGATLIFGAGILVCFMIKLVPVPQVVQPSPTQPSTSSAEQTKLSREQWENEVISKALAFEFDTSQWKTYRDEKNGFQFKYPEGMEVRLSLVNSNFWLTTKDAAPAARLFVSGQYLSADDRNNFLAEQTDEYSIFLPNYLGLYHDVYHGKESVLKDFLNVPLDAQTLESGVVVLDETSFLYHSFSSSSLSLQGVQHEIEVTPYFRKVVSLSKNDWVLYTGDTPSWAFINPIDIRLDQILSQKVIFAIHGSFLPLK